ncbi:hypothetical protein EPN90_01570 [Patescibacteria group bacterium]|nr:MAG: hypothetical protein EPN90_01570 [Patescibacteria group bacterium]
MQTPLGDPALRGVQNHPKEDIVKKVVMLSLAFVYCVACGATLGLFLRFKTAEAASVKPIVLSDVIIAAGSDNTDDNTDMEVE